MATLNEKRQTVLAVIADIMPQHVDFNKGRNFLKLARPAAAGEDRIASIEREPGRQLLFNAQGKSFRLIALSEQAVDDLYRSLVTEKIAEGVREERGNGLSLPHPGNLRYDGRDILVTGVSVWNNDGGTSARLHGISGGKNTTIEIDRLGFDGLIGVDGLLEKNAGAVYERQTERQEHPDRWFVNTGSLSGESFDRNGELFRKMKAAVTSLFSGKNTEKEDSRDLAALAEAASTYDTTLPLAFRLKDVHRDAVPMTSGTDIPMRVSLDEEHALLYSPKEDRFYVEKVVNDADVEKVILRDGIDKETPEEVRDFARKSEDIHFLDDDDRLVKAVIDSFSVPDSPRNGRVQSFREYSKEGIKNNRACSFRIPGISDNEYGVVLNPSEDTVRNYGRNWLSIDDARDPDLLPGNTDYHISNEAFSAIEKGIGTFLESRKSDRIFDEKELKKEVFGHIDGPKIVNLGNSLALSDGHRYERAALEPDGKDGKGKDVVFYDGDGNRKMFLDIPYDEELKAYTAVRTAFSYRRLENFLKEHYADGETVRFSSVWKGIKGLDADSITRSGDNFYLSGKDSKGGRTEALSMPGYRYLNGLLNFLAMEDVRNEMEKHGKELTKNKPMDEPARISDKDFNCLYNISNVYKEGDDIKVKGTCVRLGNEGKEEPLDTSICNIGTDALKDLSEAIHNRYSLNMLMDYIRERAGEDSVIRFRQPFDAKDGKAYTSLTTMDRNFYLKTEKGDKDFYSGISHEDYDALRRFLMEDKIRNTLASYYDVFKEGQDMGGTKFNFYDPDTKREFYIDTVYAGADGDVTIRGSYKENYGIHTFNSDLGILGPGGLEILDEFIADQGNFVLEQRSREPEFEKRYAPLDFTPGNEYMVRDENGDDLFVISASDHPNFEKNNPDVTYGFLDGKPEYGYMKPYKKDVQASHEYYEQNQARLSHSIIQQNPGHIYYALTAKIWKGVYEGTDKLFRDKNWKELADRAPLDGTPIEDGIDFFNVYSRFWNNPGNISEVQDEGDRYAVAIVSDGDYETKDNPHEKEYAEVFTKYTAREMKDIIRGMSQDERDRVREFLSPDIAPLFEETEREMRQKQTRKTAPVPAAKAVGDWHGDDQNLMRAYSELGALFADWRDGFTRKGLGSPLPMEYRYRDAYPVNSLSMSLWSQKNNFKVQVYITQEQAQEHGIKPVGKGVPYLRKTADGVAVTRAYNIEETDYNAIKDSRPDTAKWLSKLMRDTVDTENTWNLSAAAANAFRGKENPWVTRIEYRDDIVKDGGPSVRYDSERDTIAVHPDPGATEDLRADSMMNALTDSLLLTGRLRQMYPKDAAYSDTARMMNAIQSNTDFELCQSRVTYNMEPFSFLSSDNVSKRLREDPAFVRDLMDVSSDVTLTIESRAGALDKGVSFDDKLGAFRDEQASESAGKAVAPDEEKGQEEDRSKGIRL